MAELHKVIFEASELGWIPGCHPQEIVIAGITYSLSKTELDPDDDVIAWIYLRDAGNAQITVLND